ncbi:hypothetical protein TPA0905_13590 [Streptomyces olivaceus]|nr:hypothetical protein TPA0905_13590 [Streptomyces olivaceus]
MSPKPSTIHHPANPAAPPPPNPPIPPTYARTTQHTRLSCGQSCRWGGTGGRSGTPPAPGRATHPRPAPSAGHAETAESNPEKETASYANNPRNGNTARRAARTA